MRFDRRQHCLVEIICDDGTVGWGECLGPAGPNAAVVEAYAEALVGRDPLETERIWIDLYNLLRDQGQRGLTVTALSGIDIALWDIKGKHFGASVSTLLGGRFRESVTAYATGGFRKPGLDRVADMADETGAYVKQGFHAVKIKIGFGVEDDLRVIAAVREAIGPQTRLMIDANHGYDALEAVELGKRAERFDIDWFEEPVVPEQIGAYCAVRAGQPIPVAGGETWHGRYGMREPLMRRAVDILQPDICGTGGFSEMRRVADMAAMAGVRLVPHVWGTGVALAASLQFMAALPPNPPRPDLARADPRIRPHGEPVPPGDPDHADRARGWRRRDSRRAGSRHRDRPRGARAIRAQGQVMGAIPANTRPLDGPAPRLKAPPGAIDCHTHFYLDGFAPQAGGPPIAELATPADYAIVQKRLGLERVIVSQANAYQFDNGSTLAALDQFGAEKARAIIVVAPDTPLAELKKLHARGVRGARIMDLPGGAVRIAQLKPVERLVRELGWS